MAADDGCCSGCQGGPDWELRMAVITNHITNPAGAPSATASLAAAEAVEFAVTFPTLPPGAHHLDGRLLLLIAPAGSASEPRFMVSSDGLDTAQVFGRDVDAWLPDVPAVIGGSAVCNGAPLRSVAELPAGTYDCQCVLHLYETFNLATGHTVKLPMDRGEGQQWNKAPGNLFSPVFELTIRAAAPSDSGRGARTVPVLLSEIMPPIAPPADTEYIKHISIKSELLSAFWGREMRLGAHILLPHGFEQHPEARYPYTVCLIPSMIMMTIALTD